MRDEKRESVEIQQGEKVCMVQVELPDFTEYVNIAKKRRPKPYVKGKCRVPKKYSTEDYDWNAKGYLIRKLDGTVLVANSKTAGKPRNKKVNGQDIYNGHVTRQARATLVKAIHNYFHPYLSIITPIKEVERFPLTIKLIFYVKDQGKNNIDNDNKWIWLKCVRDTLTETGVISDDNPYIIDEDTLKTVLIPEEEEQKLIIEIYGNRNQ